jgi:hypothetical protein
MNKLIGLIQKLITPTLIVVITLTGGHAYAIAPVLDLDADDSDVIGFGYYTGLLDGATTTTFTGDDVLITDSDSNKISRAVITITDPRPGDRLDQINLKGQLTYDPSSTDTQLIVTGTGLLEKYETALGSITFSNDLSDRELGFRIINIIVEDVGGQFSNTAVTTIYVGGNGGQAAIRGFIYATVHNALDSVNISGAVVSLSNNYPYVSFELSVYESASLYILDILSYSPGAYTVHASLPGYEASSVDNITSTTSNDPSNPIQIYLNVSEADADVVPDGQLNAGDFLVAIRIVLGLKTATTEELSHGDMNGDGQLTLSDLIVIMQAIQTAP